MLRRLSLPGFGHTVGGQTRESSAQVQLFQCVVYRPCAEFLEPGFKVTRLHLATVDTFTGYALADKYLAVPGPIAPTGF